MFTLILCGLVSTFGLTECDTLPLGMLDRSHYAWLYRETLGKLERHEKLAREGKDLEASLSFASFVVNSGIPAILRPFSQDVPVKIDAAHLQWRAEELQRTVRQFYIHQGHKPEIEMSVMESINHKLDLIAGHVAGLSVNARRDSAREVG